LTLGKVAANQAEKLAYSDTNDASIVSKKLHSKGQYLS